MAPRTCPLRPRDFQCSLWQQSCQAGELEPGSLRDAEPKPPAHLPWTQGGRWLAEVSCCVLLIPPGHPSQTLADAVHRAWSPGCCCWEGPRAPFDNGCDDRVDTQLHVDWGTEHSTHTTPCQSGAQGGTTNHHKGGGQRLQPSVLIQPGRPDLKLTVAGLAQGGPQRPQLGQAWPSRLALACPCPSPCPSPLESSQLCTNPGVWLDRDPFPVQSCVLTAGGTRSTVGSPTPSRPHAWKPFATPQPPGCKPAPFSIRCLVEGWPLHPALHCWI